MGLSNIQTSRLPLTEGGFSCGCALTRGMARHPSKPQKKTAATPMQTTPKNEVQNKKSEVSKPLTLLARPVYPGTRGLSRGRA